MMSWYISLTHSLVATLRFVSSAQVVNLSSLSEVTLPLYF